MLASISMMCVCEYLGIINANTMQESKWGWSEVLGKGQLLVKAIYASPERRILWQPIFICSKIDDF